jgi:hypothetical protein
MSVVKSDVLCYNGGCTTEALRKGRPSILHRVCTWHGPNQLCGLYTHPHHGHVYTAWQ